jgi:tetratricopeptide (TPR) repeat protein
LSYLQAGNAAFKAGKFADAIAAYSEAIQTDPTQAAFYSNRAMCYMKISDYASAKVCVCVCACVRACVRAIHIPAISFLRQT